MTNHLRALPLPGWPDYSVCSDGHVFSHRLNRMLGATVSRPGAYPLVSLSMEGRRRRARMHELVLETFVGPRPAGYVCRHLNGNRTDNRLANLAYGTSKENAADTLAHGKKHSGFAKLTRADIEEIRAIFPTIQGRSMRARCIALAPRYGLKNYETIKRVVTHQTGIAPRKGRGG